MLKMCIDSLRSLCSSAHLLTLGAVSIDVLALQTIPSNTVPMLYQADDIVTVDFSNPRARHSLPLSPPRFNSFVSDLSMERHVYITKETRNHNKGYKFIHLK